MFSNSPAFGAAPLGRLDWFGEEEQESHLTWIPWCLAPTESLMITPMNSFGLCLHSERKIVSVANFLLQGSFYSGHKSWRHLMFPRLNLQKAYILRLCILFFAKTFLKGAAVVFAIFFFPKRIYELT